MDTDRWLERVAASDADQSAESAPARLKSRIYSALVSRLSDSGPLLSLPETKAAGSKLCVFEECVAVLPIGERLASSNLCRVCHARVLGEHMDKAPIFWPHCPYAAFHGSRGE
jgi:hypothetical protein